MKRHNGLIMGIVAAAPALLLLMPALAKAQWVTIARKSMGAIHNIQNEHADVATVILDAPADKVYAAAIRTMNEKEGVTIKSQDATGRMIDFSQGRAASSMKVSSLDDKVSMLTVTAPGGLRRSGDASAVVDAVLRVCRQMNVSCHESAQ